MLGCSDPIQITSETEAPQWAVVNGTMSRFSFERQRTTTFRGLSARAAAKVGKPMRQVNILNLSNYSYQSVRYANRFCSFHSQLEVVLSVVGSQGVVRDFVRQVSVQEGAQSKAIEPRWAEVCYLDVGILANSGLTPAQKCISYWRLVVLFHQVVKWIFLFVWN